MKKQALNRFRLSTFPVDDYDTSVVRIEKSRMQKLGIHEGDTVKISGVQSTGAICLSVDDGYVIPNDSEITYLNDNPVILPQIRASNLVLQNINRHGAGLIPITVEKVHDGTIPASRVCMMLLNSNPDTTKVRTEKVDGLIVSKDDRFMFHDAEPQNNFGYLITSVEPADYSQITKDTKMEFVSANPNVLCSSFGGPVLEKLQDVIPIIYEETKNNVNVMIPSIEIFGTGFRFYLYIKSNFDSNQRNQGGHVSVIVTLKDNLGNSYDLSSHGGGGTHSHEGFEYRHEFHGRPLEPNVKSLTITLHEILIQESFPPGNASFGRKPMRATKFEYAKIDKFPSFFVIQGPWKTSFALKGRHSNL